VADALLIFKPDAAYRLAARAGLWSWLATERDWKVKSLEWFQPPVPLMRERFGIFGGLNCLHLSDAPETGAAEVERWSKVVQLDRVAVKLDLESDRPDHTYHLRSLATQVAAGFQVELATKAIRDLLAEETEIAGKQREALNRIILGALA
jgi:hypothetical protein